ncbi:MAG: hypothetical protein Q8M26_02235 [Pseudolabrys sp.]|nr:hypothetical protein [Pseudolabrys sp.]
MIDTLNADKLRAWASECAVSASAQDCPAEAKARYLKMQESLLALADNADWLEGKNGGSAAVAPQGRAILQPGL